MDEVNKMGKLDNALGILQLKVEKMNGETVNLDIKPEMKDLRSVKMMMYDQKTMNDVKARMEKFKEIMKDIIQRNYPEEEESDIDTILELNDQKLFEDILVGFRMVSKEEFEKNKKQQEENLKKQVGTGNN